MLEHIFGSKTRLKMLRIFFQNGDQAFYVRELSRLVGSQINAVRREIANLLEASVIVSAEGEADNQPNSGNSKRKYFRLNEASILNQELRSLLIKARFFSEQKLVEQINQLGKIDYLLLSGCFVGSSSAPTDFLVVGELSRKDLAELVEHFEKEFGGEVRYTIMKTKEFLYRRDVADHFLSDLLSQKHVVAIDRL